MNGTGIVSYNWVQVQTHKEAIKTLIYHSCTILFQILHSRWTPDNNWFLCKNKPETEKHCMSGKQK